MNDAAPAMQPPTSQPFAAWSPTRGIWETTQLDLYGLSAPFSAIWPTCGWMRGGSAYRLPLSGSSYLRWVQGESAADEEHA